MNNISQIYDVKGDYDTALDYLDKSLKIRQQIGDRQGEATTLHNIGGIYVARKEYEKALEWIQASLNNNLHIGNIHGAAVSMDYIGMILFEHQQKPAPAIPYLLQAYQIFRQIGSPSIKSTEHTLGAVIQEIGEARFREIMAEIQKEE